MNLTNKVIIITGSSSGIGAAAAVSCSRYGAKVVVCGRNLKRLQQVVSDCIKVASNPSNVHSVQGNLLNEDDAQQLIENVVAKFGTVDCIVHSAGYALTRDTETVTLDNVAELYQLHITAPYIMIKAALPYLKKQKGSILIVSSGLGFAPMRNNLPYTVTKSMQSCFVRLLANEFNQYGIRVNSIDPAWIRTPILEHSSMVSGQFGSNLFFKYFGLKHALGRCGEPEEVGDYIAMICCGCSDHVTGQNLMIDGGAGLINYFDDTRKTWTCQRRLLSYLPSRLQPA